MATTVDLVLNGAPIGLMVEHPRQTLLDALRQRGLTGAKEGCAEGECGACAVLMVTPESGAAAYRAVNSCLMFAALSAGHEIYTVEALAEGGRLAAAQEAMAAAGGSQCGYCTPGFVVSLFAEQYRRGRTGPCSPHALGGNLCRCTGYRPIRDAALSLGAAPEGTFLARLDQPAPRLEPIDCERFARPHSLSACLTAMTQHADARLIAGGTDVAVESNLREHTAPHHISLDAIPELREFALDDHVVRIGAGLPLTDIGRLWRDAPPAVLEWLDLFASPLIRNRATLGGNLATASPIGDAAPLLIALGAAVRLEDRSGTRTVPVDGFFTGYRTTVLRPGELVRAIEIPRPYPQALRFYKIAKRRLDDISTVAAAFALDRDPDGRIRQARLAFGGVAATPLRATAAEALLAGQPWSAATVERVQHVLADTLTPMTDHRGSREYRLEVAQSLVEKFWWETRDA